MKNSWKVLQTLKEQGEVLIWIIFHMRRDSCDPAHMDEQWKHEVGLCCKNDNRCRMEISFTFLGLLIFFCFLIKCNKQNIESLKTSSKIKTQNHEDNLHEAWMEGESRIIIIISVTLSRVLQPAEAEPQKLSFQLIILLCCSFILLSFTSSAASLWSSIIAACVKGSSSFWSR